MPSSHQPTPSERPSLDSSWQEFNRLFPSEDACVEHIRRSLGIQVSCSTCANKLTLKFKSARFIKCQSCYKKHWLTAGTFFHRARQLRPWLAAIFLFERGVPVNPLQLHKLLGIAYSTAFSILKKITVVAHSAMQERATLDVSSYFFRSVFTRRSRETPARELPSSEQESIDHPGDQAESDVQETVEPNIQDPVEKEIYECLSFKPVSFDAICDKTGISARLISPALTLLELSGLVTGLFGDQYVRSAPVATSKAGNRLLDEPQQRVVDRILSFIRSKFGGISRKYLQNYISMHWCQADRKRETDVSVLDMCLGHKHVSYHEIRDYVSPALVQIASIVS